MKAHTTKKEINSRFKHVLCVDSDMIPNLLYFTPAFAYSTRVEGWACDYYDAPCSTCLCSGYSPMGKSVGTKLQITFEAKAKKINESTFLKKETKRKKILNLLTEFSNKAINQ